MKSIQQVTHIHVNSFHTVPHCKIIPRCTTSNDIVLDCYWPSFMHSFEYGESRDFRSHWVL